MDVNPLAHYLARKDISQGEFSRRIGAARGVVSRWCSGKRVPERHFALVIERETEGAVPASAWDEPAGRRAPSRSAAARLVRGRSLEKTPKHSE